MQTDIRSQAYADLVSAHQSYAEASQAKDRLSQDLSFAMSECHAAGMKLSEIGRVCNCSRQNVEARIARIRRYVD